MYSFPDQIASLLLSRGTGGLTDEEVGEKDRYLCPGSLHIFNERVREESPTGETIYEIGA